MSADNQLIPIVIEKSGRGERAYDIYSRLLKDRIIILGGVVNDDSANVIIPDAGWIHVSRIAGPCHRVRTTSDMTRSKLEATAMGAALNSTRARRGTDSEE